MLLGCRRDGGQVDWGPAARPRPFGRARDRDPWSREAPMQDERPGLRRALVALQHRDFRLFYGALVVASLGQQVQNTANLWLIYELTDSPLHLGLLGLSRGVPIIVLSLMGGLVADRVDRRRLIMLTEALMAVVSVALGVLTITGAIAVD